MSMNERAAGLLTHSHPDHWAGFSVVGACGGASGRMDRNRGMQDQATQQRWRASNHVAPLSSILKHSRHKLKLSPDACSARSRSITPPDTSRRC